MADPRPLIAHVVYRFDTGGLENGIVNLINHMDEGAFRHAVVALTEVTAFSRRIRRADVSLLALNKPPGHGLKHCAAWTRAMRQLQPDIVHTRNLGALEMQLPAWLAGVPVRLHGEHGRDMRDPHGTRASHRWIRRLYGPLVHRQVALSTELATYLRRQVGIPASRVLTLHNGVDTQRFVPPDLWPHRPGPLPIEGCPFDPQRHVIVGTVGRLQEEKDPITLVQALAALVHTQGPAADCVRLVVVGHGPLRPAMDALIAQQGLQERVWMAGERSDIPALLRGLHLYAQPSRAEGISNTILEAMASGLPVVATEVGGNPELVLRGQTGELVPAAQPRALAQALERLVADEPVRREMGRQARRRAEQEFSLRAMVERYRMLYAQEWALRGRPHPQRMVAD